MTSRTFRLFISSTFSDMAHERRILHDEVFPKLSQLCASHGAQFQAVDLRWGVNEDSQLDHKTMDICLGEIERCQRLSPKPNFLVLLGDRYGWEPVPARIPSSEFEDLRAKANAEQGELLDEWYIRDDNAVPPHHALKRRDEDFDEYREWAPKEAELRLTVRSLVDKAGIQGESRDKYFQSATHQEIARGALSLPMVPDNTIDPAEHVLACFRNIDSLPQEPNTFFDDRSVQLTALKEQLCTRLAQTDETTDNVYEYDASWHPADTDDIALTDEPAFAACVLAHFSRVITAELDGLEEVAPLEAEQQAQHAFRNNRCRHFAGREQTLGAIDAYLDGDENRVMAIIGPGGSGKSALMAQATKRVADRSGLLAYRFIGATPASTLIDSVLRSVTEELAQALGNVQDIPTKREELVEHLLTLMGQATAEQPITVVLDALDQLTEAEARKLEWLPEKLPAHAKFIVSALPSLEAPLGGTHSVRLPPLSSEAGSTILDAWLAEAGRTLQPGQRTAVLDGFAANGLPLYLKLAFERARSWGPTESPADLPTDIDGMVESMLDGLEADHTPSKITDTAQVLTAPLVQRALGLLQAARYGLAEHELLDVLSQDGEFFEAYRKTLHHTLPEDRLPVAVWSRMYLDLEPYLVEREAQGAVVLGFFHRQVGEVIGRRYGEGEAGRRSHAQLAAYFGDPILQKNFLDDVRQQPNGRKLAELPYQQFQSEQWEALEQTLTDFDLLMATCQAALQRQLIGDFRNGAHALQAEGLHAIGAWSMYVNEQSHLLARGDQDWGAEKIMLQLAVEHADNSPVTHAAEAWLEQGHCNWMWLKRVRRPEYPATGGRTRVLEGHTDSVTGVDCTQDGRILSWSNGMGFTPDHALIVWDGSTDTLLHTLTGHSDVVRGGVFCRDGRVLSWSEDHTIRLWDSATGEALALMEGHTGQIQGASLLADGRVLSWSADTTWKDTGHTVRLWDGTTGELHCTLEGHTHWVSGAACLADGRVISSSLDGTLRLWDGTTGAALAIWNHHSGSVNGLDLIPDGRILSWSSDGTLCLWDGETNGLARQLTGHSRGVSGAMYLSDGRIVSWSLDGTIRIWPGVEDDPVTVFHGHEEPVNGVSFHDERRLLSWGKSAVHVWESRSGKSLAVLQGHTAPINGARWMPNGKVLSWSDDLTLRLWDADTGEVISVFSGHDGEVTGALSLPDERILSWSRDQTLRIWNPASGPVASVDEHHKRPVRGVLPLKNSRILSWSEDSTLRTWDADFGRSIATCEGHTRSVEGAMCLDDGRFLSWARDGTLRIWDADTGDLIAILAGHHIEPAGVLLLPNHRILSWCGQTLRLWAADSGQAIATLEGHTDTVRFAEPSGNGRFVSWTYGGTSDYYQHDNGLRVWDSQTGALIATLEGHTDGVNGVLCLGDGRILSWSDDQTLRLWDVQTETALVTLEGHTGGVRGALVLEDGRILSWSTAHIDKTLRLWDATTGAQTSCWGETEAPDIVPSLWAAKQACDLSRFRPGTPLNPRRKHGSFTCSTTWCGAAITHKDQIAAIWASTTYRRVCDVLKADGGFVTFCGKSIAFLQLHHGNRRVNLNEATDILILPTGGRA